MHAEQAGRVSSRFSSSRDHSHNLGLLLTTQLWRSPTNAPFQPGGLQTNFSYVPAALHVQIRRTIRPFASSCVRPARWYRFASVRLRNPALVSANRSIIGAHPAVSASAGRVSIPPADRPCGADPKAAAVRAGPSGRRCLFPINTLALRSFQRGHLRRGVLLIGRDASVADQHCANVSPMISIKQHSFVARRSLQMVDLALWCKDVRLQEHLNLSDHEALLCAASTTALVTSSRALITRSRWICVSRRFSSRKLPR